MRKYNRVGLRTRLYGLVHLGQPFSRVTQAELTLHLFLCKIHPTVYMRITRLGGETIQVGKLTPLGR